MDAVRRITARIYPNSAQAARMEEIRLLHKDLYNACLEERIGAWKKGVRITGGDQQKSLTIVRAENAEYRELTQRSQAMTVQRLDRAYKAFFRRVKAGQTPGYPRFKSARRFSGWSLCAGEGYQVRPKINKLGRWFNGSIYLSDVGNIRSRYKARNLLGKYEDGAERYKNGRKKCLVKQIDIIKRAGLWYVSICVLSKIERECGSKAAGLDWGVSQYATLVAADGTETAIANNRLFAAQQIAAAERQRKASKSLRGKRSKRAARKHLQIARAHARLANQRRHRAHKLSSDLIRGHALIVTEELKIANMTRSAKGTVNKPGKNVAQKAGLNREILDTAPGMLLQLLKYKAEEAGTILELVNTCKVKPSQTCPKCWAQAKKTLAERVHACSCGCTMSRDGAAALVMLLSSETYTGRKPTPGSPPKTSPRAASAA